MKLLFTSVRMLLILFSLCIVNTIYAQTQCCKMPDSLRIKNVTDSSYCVQFNVRKLSGPDTSECDSAKAFELQWKRLGDSLHPWIDTIKRYNGKTTFTFCDTASPCTKYQWRVRNLCIKSGDTTKSAWVLGPRIVTPCDTGHLVPRHSVQTPQKVVQLTPNPTHDKIKLTGNVSGAVHITISGFKGEKVLDKVLNMSNGQLNTILDVSSFHEGIYFVSIANNESSVRLNFLKE